MMRIDLNSDLGEGFGPYQIADDLALMDVVTSVNIACGFHAGDPAVMAATVQAATARNIAIGAHIGYPDIQGFGRRHIAFSLKELELMTIYQLGALQAIAEHSGAQLKHASFHGALGNLAFVDQDVATTILGAMKSFDPSLKFIGLPFTEASKAAEQAGIEVVFSFLADRSYMDNGLIVSRQHPEALIKSPKAVSDRIQQLLAEGTVNTVEGNCIKIPVDSILIHSDTADSLRMAQAIKDAVISCDFKIAPHNLEI